MARLSIFAAVVALFATTGCGFQSSLAKTHEGIKAMSAEVEPPLAAHCLSKARACHAAGDRECRPLARCRKLKTSYVVATKAAHRALQEMARVHRELVQQEVIK